MSKKEEPCPKCVDGIGKYQKGWDMVKKQQVKGGKQGETEETGTLRISLYKCQRCLKLFRKGKFTPTTLKKA